MSVIIVTAYLILYDILEIMLIIFLTKTSDIWQKRQLLIGWGNILVLHIHD